METTSYNGFEITELNSVFHRIAPEHDWRDEIICVLPAVAYRVAAIAVDFYTATKLEVVGTEPLTGRLICHSVGYRMGPAGP